MRVTTHVLATMLALSSVGASAIEGTTVAPAPVPFSFNEIAQLAAGDPEAGDELGLAVAIDGDTMVVGAWRGDDECPADPNCDSGAAYVFYRDQGGSDNWGLVKKLTSSDGEAAHSIERTVRSATHAAYPPGVPASLLLRSIAEFGSRTFAIAARRSS